MVIHRLHSSRKQSQWVAQTCLMFNKACMIVKVIQSPHFYLLKRLIIYLINLLYKGWGYVLLPVMFNHHLCTWCLTAANILVENIISRWCKLERCTIHFYLLNDYSIICKIQYNKWAFIPGLSIPLWQYFIFTIS